MVEDTVINAVKRYLAGLPAFRQEGIVITA